jgi:hypothetical protein
MSERTKYKRLYGQSHTLLRTYNGILRPHNNACGQSLSKVLSGFSRILGRDRILRRFQSCKPPQYRAATVIVVVNDIIVIAVIITTSHISLVMGCDLFGH